MSQIEYLIASDINEKSNITDRLEISCINFQNVHDDTENSHSD